MNGKAESVALLSLGNEDNMLLEKDCRSAERRDRHIALYLCVHQRVGPV